MKKIYIIILCVVFTTALTGCVAPNYYYNHPVQCPNSMWVAKNAEVSFVIGEDASTPIHGLLMVDDRKIEIEIYMGIYASIVEVREILDEEENETKTIEFWKSKTVKKDIFIVTVTESTYFEENQEIVFERQK